MLELLSPADHFHGAAIPSVALARDLEVGSQASGQVIVSSSVLPVAAATRPKTSLEKGDASMVNLKSIRGPIVPSSDHIHVVVDAVADIYIDAPRFSEQDLLFR